MEAKVWKLSIRQMLLKVGRGREVTEESNEGMKNFWIIIMIDTIEKVEAKGIRQILLRTNLSQMFPVGSGQMNHRNHKVLQSVLSSHKTQLTVTAMPNLATFLYMGLAT